MGLIRSGKTTIALNRNVAAVDTATPTGDSPSGAIPIPDDARGERCHVLVKLNGNADSPSAIITLFGLMHLSTDFPNQDSTHQGIWYAVGQLNSGAAINNTTDTPTKPADNDAFFAQAFDHLSAYKKLFAHVTSMANADTVDIGFVFEKL